MGRFRMRVRIAFFYELNWSQMESINNLYI
jgi:hypothetical protein